MNAENFSKYLKNPSQLYQISYQELKSLVLQYPYSPNLRYMLMRKAKMDDHDEYKRLLNLASTYSIDRSFLFKKMKADRLIPQFEENYELNEEYLELKDLAALEVETELIEDTALEKPDELAFSLDDLVEQPENPLAATPPIPKKADNMSEENTESLLERLLEGDFADIEDIVEHEALNNLSLSEISQAGKVLESNNVEEQIIENSLEELAEESNLIERFESGSKEILAKKEAKKDLQKKEKTDVEIVDSSALPNDEKQKNLPSASGKKMEATTQLLKEEQPPSSDLKSLEELAKADKQDIKIEEEEISLTFVDDAKDTATESEATELENTVGEDIEYDKTLTLNDLSKKSSEKSQKLRPVTETSFAPKPLPKSSFNSWLQQYKSPLLDSKLEGIKEVSDKKEKKKKSKKREKEKNTLIIAKASVQEDLEIATETLASLLEKQEHYGRAIRMYETLRLRIPEKNAFFAAKIEALQKLRNEK